MSNKITIKLSDNYVISDTIREITTEEWELIFTSLSELFLLKENSFTKMTEQELKNSISKKYDNTIATLNKQLELKTSELSNVQTKLLSVHNDFIDQLNSKLTEQRDKLYEQYMKEKDVEVKMYKDKIANCKKDIEDELEKRSNTEILVLKKEIEICKGNLKDVSSEKKRLDQELYSIREQIRKELDNEFEKQYNNLYEEKLSIKDKTIANLTNEKKITIQSYSKQVETLENALSNTLHTKQDELLLNNISDIKKTLEPVLKFYGGTNNDKGVLGEEMIRNFLQSESKYEDAKILDTSGKTSKGDIYFRWRHLKCLIEVKNKKALTNEDMDKFTNDVRLEHANTSINCAMFISLQTNIYPGRTRELLQTDFIDTVPVVYIHIKNPSDINYALSCLENIVKVSVINSDETNALLSHFKCHYMLIDSLRKQSEKTIITKQRELKQLQKQLEYYNNSFDLMQADYTKFLCHVNDVNDVNELDEKSSVESDSEIEESDVSIDTKNLSKAKQQLAEQIINNLLLSKSIKLEDLCKQFSISPQFFNKLSGYKKFITTVKDTYTSSIITSEVIEKIISYKNANDKYPTRQYIIKNSIITERTLQKLNKVIKSKKILDYIFKYCEDHANDESESNAESNANESDTED
jgi:hypothetical protein